MSGRQGGGRRGGRDAAKNDDLEQDLLNSVIESLRRAKEHNDESKRLGDKIVALEEEIKSSSSHKSRSGPTPERLRKLDDLYRTKLRSDEAEKKVHEEEDIVNKLGILSAMRNDDPAPAPTRGAAGHGPKSRQKSSYQNRPIIESDVSAESGGVSPAETVASTHNRLDVLKRKGSHHQQRSSSVASSGRPPTSSIAKDAASTEKAKDTTAPVSTDTRDTDTTLHKGVLAEKAGTLAIGTEVFYKYSKTLSDDVGVGIQCIIKKIHSERKPIIYDVQDPEPDPSGKPTVHKATARDLYPIPPAVAGKGDDAKGVVFQPGATVYARYPDTDTFYRAKVVRALNGGEYTLRFEGEEDDTEKGVERRFVLDTRMR